MTLQVSMLTRLSAAQVGSKNAAFYLGASVKMTTKRQDARFVHQLSLAASELEERYKAGQVLLQGSRVQKHQRPAA